MKKNPIILLTLLCLFAIILAVPAPGTSHAQNTGAPIILIRQHDILLLSEAGGEPTTALPDSTLQGSEFSPDGTRLAFTIWSPITNAAIEQSGGIAGGALPSDVWLFDFGTMQPSPIAVQQQGAAFFSESVADNALLRSAPTWSPDGTMVAWGEVHYPDFAPETNRIMVYDLETNITTELVNNLPISAGVPVPPVVKWGPGGIAVPYFSMDPTDASMSTNIQFYDMNGTLLSQVTFPDDNAHNYIDMFWAQTTDGQPRLAVYFGPNDLWEVVDPTAGTYATATTSPQMISASSPGSSLVLSFTRNPNAPDIWTSYTWTGLDATGAPLDLSAVFVQPQGVAIAPDGAALAFINSDGSVSLWRNGTATQIAPAGTANTFDTLLWGPVLWRGDVGTGATTTTPGATPEPQATAQPAVPPTVVPTGTGCLPAPRLIIGNEGEVLPGLPNILRSEPNRTPASQTLAEIPAGARFMVLDGPVCDLEGFNWWQVNYNGTVGWTPEGQATDYWLSPVPPGT